MPKVPGAGLLKRSPIDGFVLAIFIAVLVAAVLPARGTYADVLDWVVVAAIALLFFLYGARLHPREALAGLKHWRLHLTILAMTFGVFPLLGLAIGLIPADILSPQLYAGILYLCILPSTVQSSIAFTSMAGGNVSAAVVAASASSILGMFITPLLVGLMMQVDGNAGFSLDAIEKIVLQLLVPFIAGQLLEPWIGKWVRARKKLLTPIDRGSILMVVYLAFSEAVIEGLWHSFSLRDLGVVVAINIVLLAIALSISMFGSRALGFVKEDEIAITFCGSKKSLASGVPMANAIFAGQNIGAIVLPLMLFHQIQLMACAVIAQRYATRAKAIEATVTA